MTTVALHGCWPVCYPVWWWGTKPQVCSRCRCKWYHLPFVMPTFPS